VLLKSLNVKSAINEAIILGFKKIYVGVIKELDEFLIGWESNNFKNTKWVEGPLEPLDKSQIINLIIKNNLEHLFFITHSCAVKEIGRCYTCNRCRERHWGFAQLGLTDPGTM
jgi:7-cyano-7-deazaguanine synthase in queuosine biosynthesis